VWGRSSGPVAFRLLPPVVRARVSGALREAPDHYELLDARLLGRLAGFLFCCAAITAALLLAFDPPTGPLGRHGWIAAALIIALALVSGGAMIVNRRVLSARMLMLIALSGPTMIGTVEWLADGRSSYGQLLVLSIVWGGAVLPPLRLVIVALADAFVVFLPVLYGHADDGMLAERLGTIGIVFTLAVVCLAHSARMRDVRRQLLGERAEADELARVDALTGLGNRRALDEALVTQIALASRTGRPLAALVGDLDRFKQINDRFGHHDGDRILREVALVLRDVVRTPDTCFRWGGDEFVILLAEVDLSAADEIGTRISDAVPARCATPDAAPVTITFGTAEHVAGQSGGRLLAIADAALLAEKAGTRPAV
jgi:diguanylate cyclase (GGDEF)-like protein